MVYDMRGGVVRCGRDDGCHLGTVGPTILGDRPGFTMFMGAMIMGPLAAWLMKKIDASGTARSSPASRCWSNNFSAGILARGVGDASGSSAGPVVAAIKGALGARCRLADRHNLLPLAPSSSSRPRSCS